MSLEREMDLGMEMDWGKQMGLWAGDGFGEGDGVGAEVTRQIADFCGYTKISKNCAKVPKTHHWQTEK